MINLNFVTHKSILYPLMTWFSITSSSLPANANFPKEALPEATIESKTVISNNFSGSSNNSCTPGTFPHTYQFAIANNTRYKLSYRIDDNRYKLNPGEKKDHTHQYAYYPSNCKFNYVKKPEIRFLTKPHDTESQILWGKDSYSFVEKNLDSGDIYVNLVAK